MPTDYSHLSNRTLRDRFYEAYGNFQYSLAKKLAQEIVSRGDAFERQYPETMADAHDEVNG